MASQYSDSLQQSRQPHIWCVELASLTLQILYTKCRF